MEDPDDLDIAARLLCDEDEGIEKLIRKHGRKVAGVLAARFPDVPEEDRMTALFAAARRAKERADTYDEKKGGVGAWFTTIAHRCLCDMLDEGRTAFVKSLEGLPERRRKALVAPSADFDDEDRKLPTELLNALYESIEELGPKVKAVARADLASPSGTADTGYLAQQLGVGNGTIRQHRFRYRRQLAEILKRKGFTSTKRKVE